MPDQKEENIQPLGRCFCPDIGCTRGKHQNRLDCTHSTASLCCDQLMCSDLCYSPCLIPARFIVSDCAPPSSWTTRIFMSASVVSLCCKTPSGLIGGMPRLSSLPFPSLMCLIQSIVNESTCPWQILYTTCLAMMSSTARRVNILSLFCFSRLGRFLLSGRRPTAHKIRQTKFRLSLILFSFLNPPGVGVDLEEWNPKIRPLGILYSSAAW